eukprot:1566591-Rhodomonas_salina.1
MMIRKRHPFQRFLHRIVGFEFLQGYAMSSICLRARYGMSGTDKGYAPTRRELIAALRPPVETHGELPNRAKSQSRKNKTRQERLP